MRFRPFNPTQHSRPSPQPLMLCLRLPGTAKAPSGRSIWNWNQVPLSTLHDYPTFCLDPAPVRGLFTTLETARCKCRPSSARHRQTHRAYLRPSYFLGCPCKHAHFVKMDVDTSSSPFPPPLSLLPAPGSKKSSFCWIREPGLSPIGVEVALEAASGGQYRWHPSHDR